MVNQVKQFRKVHQKSFIVKLFPQKIHFKSVISNKNYLKIVPSKNMIKKFLSQKFTSKLLPQKMHFETFILKIYLKIAPQNAFQ